MVSRWPKLGMLLLVLAQSCEHEDEAITKHCETLCSVANRCGLIPSPLGTSAQSCSERCSLSDVAGEGGVHDLIMSCLPDGGLGDGGSPDWCSSRYVETPATDGGTDAGPASDSQCENMAQCLDELWPARVTGDAIVTVRVENDGDSCSDLKVTHDASAPTLEDLKMRCDELGQPEVTLFLRDRVRSQVSKPLLCEAAIANGVMFSGVAPGWVVVGMRIEGTRTELDAGLPESSIEGMEPAEPAAITGLVCVTRWDDATNVVAAGKIHRVTIGFPDTAGLVSDCLGICAALPACQAAAPPTPAMIDASDPGDGAMPNDLDGGD